MSSSFFSIKSTPKVLTNMVSVARQQTATLSKHTSTCCCKWRDWFGMTSALYFLVLRLFSLTASRGKCPEYKMSSWFQLLHLWPQISEQQAVFLWSHSAAHMKKWSQSVCAHQFLSYVLIKPFLFLFLLVPLNVIGLALIVTEMCGETSAAGSGPCQNDLCWHFSHQT